MVRYRSCAAGLAGITVMVVLGCHPERDREANNRIVPFPGGEYSCPDHSGVLAWSAGDSAKITSIPIAGPTTLIPEFNDCQRLIDSSHHYGVLAAIWAPTAYQGHLMDSLAGGKAVAAAVIHAWDNEYVPLGIRQKWNCLYLMGDPEGTSLSARMLSTGGAADCIGTRSVASLDRGTALMVRRVAMAGPNDKDYPDVARWDRDQDPGAPYDYIGMKCGAAWCEIYAPRTTAFLPSRNYSLAVSATPGMQRVYQVKGWYDEQYLDVGSGTGKQALEVTGTIFPDPALDTLTMADFRGRWVPAGVVVLSGPAPKYQTTYGLEPGKAPLGDNGDGLNAVSLCWNGETDTAVCAGLPSTLPASCKWDASTDVGNKWYSRSQSPGRSPVYKCVERHDHSGIEVPGTARWNWQEADATQWYRCDKGCCSIKP